MEDAVHEIAEACLLLRVGRSTLYRLFDEGELESLYIGGRRMVADSQLDAYVAKRIEAQRRLKEQRRAADGD